MPSSAALAERLAPLRSDDWVLSVSLDAPAAPVASDLTGTGHIRAFFAGFLFDRPALARALTLEPADDAQILLAAYEQHGEAGLARLRGRFAAAIFDASAARAIVARDPLGSRPLFYTQVARTVHFATTPQQLARLPGVSRDLNRGALADHLCHRWPHREETFFAAVRRVPPGWLAEISHGAMRVRRYWDPAPNGEIGWLDDDEASRFDELFDQSIDRCLDTGTAGVFLSGGLDSISVAAVATNRAARRGGPRPIALSLGFPDPRCDERHLQAAVARELGLRQHLVDFWEAVGARGLLAQSLELNASLASPVLNTWGPAYHALARRGRMDGVRTIMTGMGGDEWLSVSPLISADMLARGDLAGTLGFLRMALRSHTLSRARIVRNVFWTFGLRPLASRTLHRLAPAAWQRSRAARQVRNDLPWIAPDPALRRQLRERAQFNLGPADPPGGFYAHEIRTSLDHSLVSWELEEQYQFGAAIGVDIMHPFWDADLVEMLFRLRPDVLNRGGRSKGLVRESLARRFPSLGFERQRKLSGTQFYRAIMEKEGPAVLRTVGRFDALDALGVVDGGRAWRAAEAAFDQAPRVWSQVWNLVNLEAWARAHAN
jgi:asparagine synthase (glutamine-hydrolysing)